MSTALKFLAFLMFLFAGIYGFILCFGIIAQNFGTFWAVASIFIGPLAWAIVPWYALISDGNYIPLLVTYGGGIPAYVVFMMSMAFEKKVD